MSALHAPVFTKHENTEGAQTVESADFFDLIVVEIEEDESLERAEVRDLADAVVLVVEQSQLLLALQHRTHRQAPPAHAQQSNSLHTALYMYKICAIILRMCHWRCHECGSYSKETNKMHCSDLSRFSLSGLVDLSSAVRYTIGTPGAFVLSAKITRSPAITVDRKESSINRQ